MKRLIVLLVVGAFAATGLVSGAYAGITETFTYPNGPLATGSGGLWQPWGPPAGGDSIVSGGVALINQTTDVARLFPNELQVVGNVVSYSFDVNVVAGNTAGDYQMFFSPATLPLNPGQDYASSLGFSFDWGTAGAGLANVGIWPGGGGGPTTITTMTAGAFHTISGTLTKNAATISYTVQVDGGPVFGGNSAHVNPLGINCVEMYNQTGDGATGNFQVDNLVITPEPGTMSFVAIAGLIAIRRRRSQAV